jgi:uncharacterized cupin superfamily protein
VARYTLENLSEVKDMAPEFGMGPDMEARFAGQALDLDRTGVTMFRFAPNFRVPFGHRHEDQEEVYVVVAGSARIKIDDEIVELSQWDAVRVPGDTMRNLEGGPDGAQVIAFGERAGQEASEMVPGWWSD